MKKVVQVGVAFFLLFAGQSFAQATCKKFLQGSSEGCAWCAWYNPFSNRKTVTTTYHFVCNDGTDYYSNQTTTYGCGTC
jgi:hypothetical protein